MSQQTTRDQLSEDLVKTGLSSNQARDAVDLVISALANHLARGEEVELRGLGSFHRRLTKARPGRNPMKPQQEVTIPARWVLKFRPGKLIQRGLASLPVENESERIAS